MRKQPNLSDVAVRKGLYMFIGRQGNSTFYQSAWRCFQIIGTILCALSRVHSNNRGGTVLHIGGPIVVIVLVVAFLLLTSTNPEAAFAVKNELAGLVQALKGVAP